MTWAAGWFNDWLENGASRSDDAGDYVGRVSGLAWVSPDNRDYVHLGLGLMHHGPDSGETRFAGRPESNVADKFTDTGDFPANHANQLSLEGLVSRGPFSVLAERVEARVDAPASGDPRFWGAYVAASWMLTGESRPYNRVGGWAGGITPRRRLGAVELVAKYSRVDLTDGSIDGGRLDKWHLGVGRMVRSAFTAVRRGKVKAVFEEANLRRADLAPLLFVGPGPSTPRRKRA